MSTTTFEKTGDTLTVAPNGKLDTSTSPVLEKEIAPYIEDTTNIVLDFKNVKYISSRGMRVIIALEQEMSAKNGSLRLTNANDDIMEIFEMVGFVDFVQID